MTEALQELWLTHQSTVAFIGLNGLLALSVYTTLSCGQLSLAQAAFMAIGAYASAILTFHAQVPFALELVVAAVLPALVALPLGLPVLRLKGVFLAIATIGFGEVVRIFFVNLDFTNGALGLTAVPQRTSVWMIYAALAGALLVLSRIRREKQYDLRPLIEWVEVRGDTIAMRLAAREGATGRPEEVLAELGIAFDETRIERTKLIFKE